MASNPPTHTNIATISDASEAQPQQHKWPGWPGHIVYRLVVPLLKVGIIIGRKGESVKKLCQETGARVTVLDAPITSAHRIVVISGKEEPEAALSPAMVAVMRLSKRLNGLPEGDEDDIQSSGPASVAFCSARLLLPSTQAISLIGRQGSTIKSIQEGCGATIRVISSAGVPTYVNSDEKVVELQGEAVKVIKALECVVGHLRKFLVDHSVLPLFEKSQNSTPVSQNQQTENWADKMMLHPTTQAGMGSNDYPLSVRREMLYIDRERNQDSLSSLSGLSYYGQGTGLSGISSLGRGSIITQVAQTMQIPLMYANDIIGFEGSNIEYIRHSSGAVLTVTVQESLGSPDAITVEIKGTSSAVQVAKQLIEECVSRHNEVFPEVFPRFEPHPPPSAQPSWRDIGNFDQVFPRSYDNTEPDSWSSYSQMENSFPPFGSQQYEPQYPYGSSGLGGYGATGCEGSSELGGHGSYRM